jgi:hypothetical protein
MANDLPLGVTTDHHGHQITEHVLGSGQRNYFVTHEIGMILYQGLVQVPTKHQQSSIGIDQAEIRHDPERQRANFADLPSTHHGSNPVPGRIVH